MRGLPPDPNHWERLVEILGAIPPGSKPVDRSALEESIAKLATELQGWLVNFGFEWSDDAGNSGS